MKKGLLLLLGVMLSQLLFGQSLRDGLVFYAPFDGNTVNLVNWVKPRNYGVAFTENRFGDVNSAVAFNGEHALLDYGEIIDLGQRDFSISLWFRISNPEQQAHFGKLHALINKGLVEQTKDNHQGWCLSVTNFDETRGNTIHLLAAEDLSTEHTASLYANRPQWQTGSWYHLVAVRSGNTYQLYLNGESVESGELISDIDLSVKHPLTIGAAFGADGSSQNHFKGAMDDLRIYNRALSLRDIEALYQPASQQQLRTVDIGRDTEVNTQISVYPNPTTRLLNLKFTEAADRRLEVVDESGRRMIMDRSESEFVSLNVAGLPPGSYFLRIKDADRVSIHKFIKQGTVLP